MMPVKLTAPLKDYIWGGTRLKTEYGKQTDMQKVAEAWELSCHKDGSSIIESGEFKGMTLPEYIEKRGKAVLGSNCDAFEYFPVLIKLIDAKDNLSVQVHPNNEYALKTEGEYGKTEMWYIVDCDEGASLIYGFKDKISREEFKKRISENTLTEVTNSVPVKKGDVFFIEAGTLHAIGKGILIAEIQQNSNTTYRVYDYGRTGADGKPRQLHIEKAIDVTRLEKPTREPKPQGEPKKTNGGVKTLLSQCEYFTVEKLELCGSETIFADEKSFNSILVTEGEAELSAKEGRLTAKKGDSIFVEAGTGEYTLSGNAEIILTKI